MPTPPPDEYPAEYGDAVRPRRYSADHADHANLPTMLASLKDADRWGGSDADHTTRGVVADYLSALDREPEAELLRSGRHVVVDGGVVKPGRFTLRHVLAAVRRADAHLQYPSGQGPVFLGPMREYRVAHGGREWVDRDPRIYTTPDQSEYAIDQMPDRARHAWHPDGTPMVYCSDSDCYEAEIPLSSLREHVAQGVEGNATREGMGVHLGDWRAPTPDQTAAARRAAGDIRGVPIDEPQPEETA